MKNYKPVIGADLGQWVVRRGISIFSLLILILFVVCSSAVYASTALASQSGCIDGSKRVGTFHSPGFAQKWAIIVNCAHPGWPARLAPDKDWAALPVWVPAGSRVLIHEVGSQVVMNLVAVTVMPGSVGQKVKAKLRDGAQVEVELTGKQDALLMPSMKWR